eukprot:CAMPEP_0206420814 /NCGR_PEP_ID=MMETSP0324_2-20121206/1087_1 /ASSEMBLY_ACC=CAM_ASM_000836 /TAXON_ID=2866 /ORGANISM="Crypthecodinium cohnii, Strain Seligo" /LENGTH=1054 /DNA_ID=CAMNT_0053884811 /DNA_START=55 /DNA_END=3219 /DNA_ORIENTATION=+
MASAGGNLPLVKVFFRWDCAGVKKDEEVRVVGASEALGNWLPACAVPMHRDSVEEACWTSKGVFLPLGHKTQYKYVVCKQNNGEVVRWEELEGNREVIPTGRRLVAEDDDGLYRDVTIAPSFARRRNTTAGSEAAPSPMAAPSDAPSGSVPMPRLESFQNQVKEKEIPIDKDDHIFAIFRTLPVRLKKNKDEWVVEEDGDEITFKVVSMMYRSIPKGANIKFVGHPGVFVSDPVEQRKIAKLLAPFGCIPVWIDEQVFNNTLNFCHTFLWPVMHNMKVFEEDGKPNQDGEQSLSFEEAQWKDYQVFNRAYAEALEGEMVQGSIFWIHDFYLLLVPRALKLRRPDANIGLFLHSAFPMSEVMRCIPTREEILQSMLSCKVVTFQIFEYARHFLSCCQLILNSTYYFYGAGVLYVEHESESVVVRADHFVLPFADFVTRVEVPRVKTMAADLRKQFGNKLIFVSIDGDEPFSGLILKLRAFQKFLRDCPQHVHRVGLLQHVLVRKTGEPSELMKEIRRMADEINKEFSMEGEVTVDIRVGDVSVDERIAILKSADIFLDTSINDGLNLHPFLFCVAHQPEESGAMIVSEFSGCSSVLIGSTKVNPWNTQAVMDAMHTVVTTDEAEKSRRFKQDHSYVVTQKLCDFVASNLAEIKTAAARFMGPVRGLGAGFSMHFMERGFRHLSFEAVCYDYKKAKIRAIFVDNEGTLAPDRRNVIQPYGAGANALTNNGQAPDPQVLESLQSLAADRANVVMVISGRPKDTMDSWFGSVKELGLCAEHGFYYVPPAKMTPGESGRRWHCISKDETKEDADWIEIARTYMEKYQKRVQGSVLECKGSAVTWNYRKVGAQMLANEIAQEMVRFMDPSNGPESLMYGYPVVVVNGKGYVEVKRSDVDKGVIVDRMLQEMRKQFGPIDFVLCIGDDRSDEDMFEIVNDFAKKEGKGSRSMLDDDGDDTAMECLASPTTVKSGWSSSGVARLTKKASLTLEEFNPADMSKSSQYYTVTVGRKPSQAGFFVKDVGEVSDVLQRLALQARVTNLSRFSSMPTLVHSEDGDSD